MSAQVTLIRSQAVKGEIAQECVGEKCKSQTVGGNHKCAPTLHFKY
jgi:hypothetical protein